MEREMELLQKENQAIKKMLIEIMAENNKIYLKISKLEAQGEIV